MNIYVKIFNSFVVSEEFSLYVGDLEEELECQLFVRDSIFL